MYELLTVIMCLLTLAVWLAGHRLFNTLCLYRVMEFYKQQKDIMMTSANKWLTGLVAVVSSCLH